MELQRTVMLHERIDGPVFRATGLLVIIDSTQRPALKVSTASQLWVIFYLGSPLVKRTSQRGFLIKERARNTDVGHAIVVPPDFTTRCAPQQSRFER
jgi:hypothetical protein